MKVDSCVIRIVLDDLVARWIYRIQRPQSLGNLILLGTSEVEKPIDQGLDSMEQLILKFSSRVVAVGLFGQFLLPVDNTRAFDLEEDREARFKQLSQKALSVEEFPPKSKVGI